MKTAASKGLIAGLLVALAVILFSGVASWWRVGDLVEHDALVSHTYEVLAALKDVPDGFAATDVALRVYPVSKDRVKTRRDFEAALERLGEALARVERLTVDNRAQQERLVGLRGRIEERLGPLGGPSPGRDDAFRKAVTSVQRDVQRERVGEVRGRVREMIAEEHQLLHGRREISRRGIQVVYGTIAAATGLSLVALVMVCCLGVLDGLRRRGAARILQDQTLKLDDAVRDREESQTVLDTLMRTAPVGMAYIDTGFRYRRINDHLAAINGVPAAAHLGRCIAEVLPELWPKLEPLYRAVLETGEPGEGHEVSGVTARTQEQRHWLVNSYPVPGPDGGMIGIGTVVVELTERKRAEQALRDSEERFRQLADAMPQMVWTARPDGHLDYYNKRWYEFTGYTEGGVGGGDASWLPILHPDDAQRCLDTWYGSVQSGEPYQIEYRFRDCKAGAYRWHLGRALPVRDEAGRITRWFGTSTDIDDQKRAEASARESQRTIATVLASMPDPCFGVDRNWRYTYVNREWENLFGRTAAEVVGKVLWDLFPDTLGTPIEETYRKALREGAPVSYVVFSPYAERWVEVRSYPTEEGMASYMQDVSLRRQAEEVLRQSHAELEARVRERTAELTASNEALRAEAAERQRAEAESRKAREVAEAANRAKSEFLANMSHEIRTPMNGILGMTELALDTELSSDQREFMTTVKASAESLLTVINDILDFSKVEAGMLQLDFQPFDLRDGLADTLKPLSYRAHRKGLELACRVVPGVPDGLVGDLGRLRQVIVNLVGNAIKFTESGEVLVQVEAAERTAEEVVLHVLVRDTGIGIPAPQCQMIFEPFVQGDGSMTRTYGGTGLGLTISKRLVSLMGGVLWVESTPGEGSTFHFTARYGVSSASPATPPTGLAELEGKTVLVVDDNATNRLILEELLAHWGMRPHGVGDAAAARAEFDRAGEAGHAYELLLLDATLPGDEAFFLATAVYTHSQPSVLPLVLLTVESRTEFMERWNGIGLPAYLSKPVKQSRLFKEICRLLGPPGDGRMVPLRPSTWRPISRSSSFLLTRLHILLAEDNLVNQLVSSKMLTREGHTVVVANNGKEALAAIEGQPFDLVLMDVQMPEMDGIEATRALRQAEAGTGRHLPVIALTAHALSGDHDRCLDAGMDGYVAKPVQGNQLWDAINRVVGRGKCRPAVPPPATPLPVGPVTPTRVFDRAMLLSRLGDNEELLPQVIAMFQAETPREMDMLRAGLEGGDAAGVERAAHKLKGSLSLFGADQASGAAAELETVAQVGDLVQAGEVFVRLRQAVHALDRELSVLRS